MIIKKLLFILIALFSGFCAYADPWDPDFDGPEPPPDDVSIFHLIWFFLALLFAAYLFIRKVITINHSIELDLKNKDIKINQNKTL
jgi:hypothetical protein